MSFCDKRTQTAQVGEHLHDVRPGFHFVMMMMNTQKYRGQMYDF
jgi:hypothetical protein